MVQPAQPAALVHPAFATLLEGLDGAEVDQDTSRLCTQLYAVMARSYSRPRPVTRKQQAQEARNISDEEIGTSILLTSHLLLLPGILRLTVLLPFITICKGCCHAGLQGLLSCRW